MVKSKYHLHGPNPERGCRWHTPSIKTLPIIFVTFLFFLMVVCVMVVEFTRTSTMNSWSSVLFVNRSNGTEIESYGGITVSWDFENFILEADNTASCSIPYDCNVLCKNMLCIEVASYANQLSLGTSTDACENNVKLTLDNITFENGTMSNGWLNGLKFNVKELEITCEGLSELGDRVFAHGPFAELETLTIRISNIWTLRKKSFEDCTVIYFQFRHATASSKGITAEENVFESMSKSLVTLQFNQCINDSETIKNITGRGSTFTRLYSIDLRSNTFTTISNNTFSKANQLLSLYMSENIIEKIEHGAFNGIEEVQQLYINNNLLTTLPEGLFDRFSNSSGHIYIQNNPWRCDCDLEWFKSYYEQSVYFHDPTVEFMCYQDGKHVNYTEVNFCPEGTTSTTNTDTIKTTTKNPVTQAVISSTPSTGSYREIICTNIAKISSYKELIPEGSDLSFTQSVKVSDRGVSFDFYQVEDLSDFKVIVNGRVGSDYIIWTNVLNQSDYGCVFNVSGVVYLDLQYGQTYTLCLSKYESIITSTDCTAVTVPLQWSERTWIANKQMSALIGGFITASVFAIFVTSVCAYYIIRQNPYLIQGNKRVVIVKNKDHTDAIVLPNYYSRPKAFSVYTNSEGYLTPKHRHYSKIKRDACRSLDTITENFVRDAVMDDCSSECPSPCPDDFYEVIPPPPPPLPPNHPCERRSSAFNPYFHSNL